MQTRVDLNFHTSAGWVSYPAGTTVQTCSIGALSPKEQRTFKNILKDNMMLVELGGQPRAINKADLIETKEKQMMFDMTEREKEAIRSAAAAAGEYVEGIKKSELRLFSLEEFFALVQSIVSAYLNEKARLDACNFSDDIPF